MEEYFFNILCPKEGEPKLNIVLNSTLLTLEEERFERREQQADLLIVDGTILTYSGENYREYINAYASYRNSFKWNFLIADDGVVFEDMGFDYFYDNIKFGGLDQRSLTIGFIKRERDAAPSEKAMNTFHQLVRLAICSRKLIPLYKLIPYYLIWDCFRISNKSFERNQLSVLDRYESDMEFISPYQKEDKFNLQIVSYSDLSEKVIKNATDYSGPAENVVIMQSPGIRCFHNCFSVMKASGRVRSYFEYYYHRGVNFFIPEDGYIYEYYGWGNTNNEWVKEKKAVFILLEGEFHNYGPNTIVFSALKELIQEGLNKGYLSSNYEIVSSKEYFPFQWFAPGEYLENQIKNLDL